MHFPFHCFKSASFAFHFVEIFYFLEILSKNGWYFKPWDLNTIEIKKTSHRANKYMLKDHNKNTRTRCEINSKLIIKTPDQRHWPHSDVFLVNFTYFTQYYRVSTDFEQEKFCSEFVLRISIYPRAERRHRSAVSIFNFENNSPLF